MDKIIDDALQLAHQLGQIDGAHHKAYAIDQIVRVLTKCPVVELTAYDCHGKIYTYQGLGESDEYIEFVRCAKEGEEGPETYSWDIGVAP